MPQFKTHVKANITGINLPFAEYIDDVLPQKIDLAKADIRNEITGLNLELENKIKNVELDFADDIARADALALENKRALDEGLDTIFKQADEISSFKIRLDAAEDTLKSVGETAAKAGLTALDAIGKILDIGNFILQLGTAARMEFIYNELKNQNAIFEQALAEIYARLANINATDAEQQAAIDDLYRLLDMNNSQFDSLLGAIQALSQYLTPLYNNSFQSLYKLDNLIDLEVGTQSKIDSLTQLEIQTQTQIDSGLNGLPPKIKSSVCEALADCFEYPDFSGINQKLDNILDSESDSGLGEVLRRIGMFPNNCLQQSISHALCGGGAGGGGIDFNEALEDYFANNETVDLQPILDSIEELKNTLTIEATEVKDFKISDDDETLEELPKIDYSNLDTAFKTLFTRIESTQKSSFEAGLRANLFVPDEWAIKLEGDRPQLIAGMQDAAKAGTGSASKWQIVVPRPKSSVLSMDWDELSAYFPTYNRGAWAAIAKLKDGSVMRVRASSQNAARTYLNKMMELVDPAYSTEESFLFQYNERYKSVSVVCRGIAYYANGRKDGAKPTKRWYFPVEDQ
jgi:hypothetical protein